MNLIIRENGESDIENIAHYDAKKNIMYHYKGEEAKEIIRLIHKAILGEDIKK